MCEASAYLKFTNVKLDCPEFLTIIETLTNDNKLEPKATVTQPGGRSQTASIANELYVDRVDADLNTFTEGKNEVIIKLDKQVIFDVQVKYVCVKSDN